MRDTPEGRRVFGSRFIEELKRAGEGLCKEARLVAQNYQDVEASKIATKAPTGQRSSQCILFRLAAYYKNMSLCKRDVSQFYVQSDIPLERPVDIEAPPEMNLGPDIFLRVVRPLYGIPESTLHWYLMYLDYHTHKLHMTRATTYPCIMISGNEDGLEGLIALQVDDTVTLVDGNFLQDEEEGPKQFKTKESKTVSNTPMGFNGIRISKDKDGVVYLDQIDKCDVLTIPITQKQFCSKPAMCQYIAVNRRPNTSETIQLIAPASENTTGQYFKILEKTIHHLKDTMKTGLKYAPVDMSKAKVMVFSNDSLRIGRRGG